MFAGKKILLVGWTLGVVVFAGCGKPEARKGPPPPPRVVTVLPEEREVLEYEDLPGRIDAIEDVEIKARVTGYLNKVEFKEGSEVKKGDLLFSIDPREYQAEVDSANAALQQAQAKYLQEQSDLERAKQLSKSTVIAKQELESQGTEVLEAAAGVRAAQAALAKAQLNLEYTQIRAPIDGKISSTAVTVGNLVAAGDTLTSIVRQSPVYVYFEAPERAVLRWDKAVKDFSGQGLTCRVQAHVGLLNETGFPRAAKVDFSDNELNAGTGTLRLRGVLDNEDRRLRVGLYARVRVSLDQPRKTLLVPERAVGVDQGQRFVYVVNAENKVEYRKVAVGQIHDGMLSITDGLKPDDRVITEGLLALRPGLVVQPEAKVAAAP
jgi:multidrug efflux system membrane fusion protein